MEAARARLSAEIALRGHPFEREIALLELDTIPGVARAGAEALPAEMGPDMSRFPSARHLASWAGVRPGHHERAGKRQAAAPPRRTAARRGRKKAIVALGHSILVSADHILATQTPYRERGG